MARVQDEREAFGALGRIRLEAAACPGLQCGQPHHDDRTLSERNSPLRVLGIENSGAREHARRVCTRLSRFVRLAASHRDSDLSRNVSVVGVSWPQVRVWRRFVGRNSVLHNKAMHARRRSGVVPWPIAV